MSWFTVDLKTVFSFSPTGRCASKKTTLYAEPAVEDYDHYTFFNLDGHIPYMGVGTFLKKLKLTGISLNQVQVISAIGETLNVLHISL